MSLSDHEDPRNEPGFVAFRARLDQARSLAMEAYRRNLLNPARGLIKAEWGGSDAFGGLVDMTREHLELDLNDPAHMMLCQMLAAVAVRDAQAEAGVDR